MLVSFTVGNFRSFGDEATLSMVASKRLEDHPGHRTPVPSSDISLLRTAVIYGANAAGKSNLVKAMSIAQTLITTGETPPIEPHRISKTFSDKPSTFEFRFLIDGRIFAYGFDIKLSKIESEWLAYVKSEEDLIAIFERDASGNSIVNEDAKKHFPERHFQDAQRMFKTLHILKSLPLTEHQLFLNRALSIPHTHLGKLLNSIIKWLTDDLLILRTDHQACDILDRLQCDELFRQFCKSFLNNVATGVTDLKVIESHRPATDWERRYMESVGWRPSANDPLFGMGCMGHSDSRISPTEPNKMIVRTLMSGHGSKLGSMDLPFSEESDGTQQLLHFMPVIYPAPNTNKVVVIDELDRSLHPLICWEFIRFFSESCAGSRRQLIVTTHEAHLLDQDLLRRDEYWFVEKDSMQQSRLVSLSDFNIRKDLQIQKGYLQGRFGAIPLIGGMDALLKLLNCGNQESVNNAAEEKAT